MHLIPSRRSDIPTGRMRINWPARTIFLFPALFLALSSAPHASAEEYDYDRGSTGGLYLIGSDGEIELAIDDLQFPVDIARLPHEGLLLADWGGWSIETIGLNGQRRTAFQARAPLDVDLDASGQLLITSQVDHSVVLLSPDQDVLWINDEFTAPTDADFLPNGNLLITDGRENRVVEMSLDGKVVWEFARGLKQPYDTDLTPRGTFLIANYDAHQVIEVNREGEVLRELGRLNHPRGVSELQNGHILIADMDNGRALEVDRDGVVANNWKGLGKVSDVLRLPDGRTVIVAGPDPQADAAGGAEALDSDADQRSFMAPGSGGFSIPPFVGLLVFGSFLGLAVLLGGFLFLRYRGTPAETEDEPPAPSSLRYLVRVGICFFGALLVVLVIRWMVVPVMDVEVAVRGEHYTVSLNGTVVLQADDASLTAGGIGIGLNADEGPRQAWRNVRILDATGERELYRPTELNNATWTMQTGQWFSESDGEFRLMSGKGSIAFASPAWESFVFRGELVNPVEASVLLRVSNPTTLAEFWMRPERHHDAGLKVLHDGKQSDYASLSPVGLDGSLLSMQLLNTIATVLTGALVLLLLGGAVNLALILLRLQRASWAWKPGLLAVAAVLVLTLAAFPSLGSWKPLGVIAASLFLTLLVAALVLSRKRTHRFLQSLDLPGALFITIGFGVAAALLSLQILEAMPHVQDSLVILFQSKILAMGRLSLPSPELYRFFDHEFIVNEAGRWYGIYPPGAPALLVPGLLAGVPWVVNPLLGAAGLFLIYLTGRLAFDRVTAFAALTLGSLSSFALILSASFMSHAASMAFLALFTYGYFGLLKEERTRFAVLAGVGLGGAILIRPQSAFAYAVPFMLASAMVLLSAVRESKGNRTATLRKALKPQLLLSGIALAGVLLLLAYNWRVTGSPLTFPMRVYSEWIRFGFGTDVGIEWPSTHTPARGLANFLFNLAELQQRLFGWERMLPHAFGMPLAGLTLTFMVVPFVSGRFSRWDLLLAGVIVSTATLFFFYFAHGVMYGPRFYFECLPAFLLLTGRGLSLLFVWLSPPVSTAGSTSPAAAVPPYPERGLSPLLALLLVFLLASLSVRFNREELPRYRGYNLMHRQGLEAVERAGLSRALVFVDADERWQQYGQFFWTLDPDLDANDVLFARDRALHNVGVRGDTPVPNEELMKRFPDRSYYYFDGFNITPLPRPEALEVDSFGTVQ